jgi:xanthine dehydrogenase accessory factor
MRDVLEAALQAEREGGGAALVTVIATEGATPRKAGAKMVAFADGRIVGTIGGGRLEAEMATRARVAIETRRTEVVSYDLTLDQVGEEGLVCGGSMQVFIEPIEPAPTLCLFGAGHVAQPLAHMAKLAGFRVEVLDDRERFANRERFPDADLVLAETLEVGASHLTLGAHSFAVVVTRGYRGDADALECVLAKELRFVGLLGSRPKRAHIVEELERRGVPASALHRVYAPLGLEIGAETPHEIAVSILAEMIAVRRGIDPAQVGSKKAALPSLGLRRTGRRGIRALDDAS